MDVVKIQEAKTHLSRLIAKVERGDDVTISRGDVPVARLVAVTPQGREMGFLDIEVPDSAFDPLEGDELARWEGA